MKDLDQLAPNEYSTDEFSGKEPDSKYAIHPLIDYLILVIVSFITFGASHILIEKAWPTDLPYYDFTNSTLGFLMNFLILVIFLPSLQFVYILPGYLCTPEIRKSLKFVLWVVLGAAPILFMHDKVFYISITDDDRLQMVGIFDTWQNIPIRHTDVIILSDTGIVQCIRFITQNRSTNTIFKFESSKLAVLREVYQQFEEIKSSR